jgi:hypothetical protein
MINIVKELFGNISQSYIDMMIDNAAAKIDLRAKQITDKAVFSIKRVVPPLVFSTLFFGIGVLILIVGASTYIDSLLLIKGAGMMLGGGVLVFLGFYYKLQLEKWIDRIAYMDEYERPPARRRR